MLNVSRSTSLVYLSNIILLTAFDFPTSDKKKKTQNNLN